jgi:hypothetical protein
MQIVWFAKRLAPLLLLLLLALPGMAQRPDVKDIVAHKWRVIWYSDDGKVQNMEAKKQQLVLRPDGTGQASMMGEKVGDIVWSVAGKNKIYFQDDPSVPAYLVKVSKYKNGINMLFTGTLPNGYERKVYFERLSGK